MALFSKSELHKTADRLLRAANGRLDVAIVKQTLASMERKAASIKKGEFRWEFDIFLSHGYLDKKTILGLVGHLEDLGFYAYVDWINDPNLDRAEVTEETADLLRERMKKCKSLFFANSLTSGHSKWMPWECGYFDGINGRVAICPITEQPISGNKYEGQEYLGLYPYVIGGPNRAGIQSLWIAETSTKYVLFADWLKGDAP